MIIFSFICGRISTLEQTFGNLGRVINLRRNRSCMGSTFVITAK